MDKQGHVWNFDPGRDLEEGGLEFRRSSGLLLHPTSLPGRFGIGSLGADARQFLDFLAVTGQRFWQMLPLGPTGYGDSPYQSFSSFAGNPLLISLEILQQQGYLQPAELEDAPAFPATCVDYGAVIRFKSQLLTTAYLRFKSDAGSTERADFEEFCTKHSNWLDDYTFFIALKNAHGGIAWNRWDPAIAARLPEAVQLWRSTLSEEIQAAKWVQFQFFRQWHALREHSHALGVRLIGDLPIFVAHDSADVWAHPELFMLSADGSPEYVAGVPPDYFSGTGQLWGNPLYRWDALERTGYQWWIERFRAALEFVDVMRLDHFRGFQAYWEIPGRATSAANGRWVTGPGATLFEKLRHALGELPIIAENLGVITPEVEALRTRFGFPGMAILQFAFGTDPQGPDFLPHNYPVHRVVYTGTHDNDTTVGWWTSGGAGDSTRTAEDIRKEREFARKYLDIDGREIHWVFIRAVLSSVASLAIIPLQDVLGLGSEARMNVPSRPTSNWRWRYRADALTPEIRDRLAELVRVYDRR